MSEILKNAVREFRISIRFYPETTKSSLRIRLEKDPDKALVQVRKILYPPPRVL